MPQTEPVRCIACEELELARVRDQAPSQTLPIPNAAMAGFPEGRGAGALTRRRLLQAGVAGFAAVYGPKLLGFESVWEAAVAEGAVSNANQLVVLYLAGGNDGLNTLVPIESNNYNNYKALRPTLYRGLGATALGRVGSQPLTGAASGQLGWANVGVSSSGGGDNGSSSFGFDKLYGPGDGGAGSDLAVLPAVDYLPPNLSHFESSDYWFAGALQGMTTGWLGRWLDKSGSASNPLQAISIDTALSKSIRTQTAPVCAINSLSSLGFTMNPQGGANLPGGGVNNPLDANATLNGLGGVPVGANNLHLARSRTTYSTAVDVYTDANPGAHPFTPGSNYPAGSSLSTKLKLAAHLLGLGLGTRVVTIHWGSFDTHGSQLSSQDPQLQTLSLALGAFQADLAARGIAQNVTTLVFSEFGRRVAENSSGTDHGAGGLMMLAGQPVKGGWAADFPGTKNVDLLNGNLKVPTDFRAVYGQVLSEWLGEDPNAILGAGPWSLPARPDGQSGLFK
jgi:uncharacterized protein (DUF1501 family)